MEIASFTNTGACSARPRSGASGISGTPWRIRIGNGEVAPDASVVWCAAAGIGERGKGGRVSAGGEDV